MTRQQSPFCQSISRLLKRKTIVIALVWLVLMVITAASASWLANEKPVFFSYQNNYFFPALSGDEYGVIQLPGAKDIKIDFRDVPDSVSRKATSIYPLIPYSPNKSDLRNSGYVAPGEIQYNKNDQPLAGFQKHILGTGRRGEDILSGIIHGSRVSMSVGFFSMAIAGIIGLILGALAGYYGDNRLRLSRGELLMTLLGLFPAWFYGFQQRSFELEDGLKSTPINFLLQLSLSILLFGILIFLFNRAGKLLSRVTWFKKEIFVLVDTFISRLIEILISLPRLILIISVAAISKPSLLNLVLIIGFTSWTEIARFTRSEMMRVRSLDYIQSARSLGFSEWRIIFMHALPNAVAPALITISFGIAGAILMESALSFLGIGVPPDIATWGSLLAAGRENFSAWWLVVFPGLAIFITVTAFNLLGEGLRDAFDPKMKS